MAPPVQQGAYLQPGGPVPPQFRRQPRPAYVAHSGYPAHPGYPAPGHYPPPPTGYARHSSVQPHPYAAAQSLPYAASATPGPIDHPHYKELAYYHHPHGTYVASAHHAPPPPPGPPRYLREPSRGPAYYEPTPAPTSSYYEEQYGVAQPSVPLPPPPPPPRHAPSPFVQRAAPYNRALTVQPTAHRTGPSRRALDFLLKGSGSAADGTGRTPAPPKKEEPEAAAAQMGAADDLARSMPRQMSLGVPNLEHHGAAQPGATASLRHVPPKDEGEETRSSMLPPSLPTTTHEALEYPAFSPHEDEKMPIGEPASESPPAVVADPPVAPPAARAGAAVAAKEPIKLYDWSIRLIVVPNLPPTLVDDVVRDTGLDRQRISSLHRWIAVSGTRRFSKEAAARGNGKVDDRPDAVWRTNIITALAEPARGDDGAWRVATFSGTVYELVGRQSSHNLKDYLVSVRQRALRSRGAEAGVIEASSGDESVLERWLEANARSFEQGWRARIARACVAFEDDLERRLPQGRQPEPAKRKRARVNFAPDAGPSGDGAPVAGAVIEPAADVLHSEAAAVPGKPAKRMRTAGPASKSGDAAAEDDHSETLPTPPPSDTFGGDISHIVDEAPSPSPEPFDRSATGSLPRRRSKPKDNKKESFASSDDDIDASFSRARPRGSSGLEVVVEIPQRGSSGPPRTARVRSSDAGRGPAGEPASRAGAPSTRSPRRRPSATPRQATTARTETPSAEAAGTTTSSTPVRVKTEAEMQALAPVRKIPRELMLLMSGPFGANPAARRGFLEGCSVDNPIVIDRDETEAAAVEPSSAAEASADGNDEQPSSPSARPSSEGPAATSSAAQHRSRSTRSGNRTGGKGVAKFWMYNPITSPQVTYQREAQNVQRRRAKILQTASKRSRLGLSATTDGKGATEAGSDGPTLEADADQEASDELPARTAAEDTASSNVDADQVPAPAPGKENLVRSGRRAAKGPRSYSVRKLVQEQLQKLPRPFTATAKRKAKIPIALAPAAKSRASKAAPATETTGKVMPAARKRPAVKAAKAGASASRVPRKRSTKAAAVHADEADNEAEHREGADGSDDDNDDDDDEAEWEDTLAEHDINVPGRASSKSRGEAERAYAAVEEEEDDDDMGLGLFQRFQTITGDNREDPAASLGFGIAGDPYYFSD
ncbi:uncharacterized protein PFL1_02508 [Pseudozyma flocculosa PF-1]|uniref:Uncharacterized protein n=2 Tax=Pseudozyma flocculosa TaxID=84751 RepID=A0A5C3EZ75_9BASI|nr:uncharacterized protein PFL1_02508 [Pseudozyma flocculosa PF-1]EPQ29835.1 hypothetical protein PFL1_02508 [Pseudozyma flocculosa PF-1]SPO37130.1 uncharacterized protein PSFLO_02602 [Pseudozyma flocculosa]